MKGIRSHLTYANVVSTICLFLVLGGATAFAAKELAPNSVGTKQLQQEAVTAAKIRAGAVKGGKLADGAITGEKLADGSVSTTKLGDGAVSTGKLGNGAVSTTKLGDGAVSTGKLADGSVTAKKLDPGLVLPVPNVPVVHRLQNVTSLEFPVSTTTSQPIPLPLANATFTQAAGEDDLIVASIDAHVPASCHDPRDAEAFLRLDAGHGRFPDEFVGRAIISDNNSGEATVRAQFVPNDVAHGIVSSAPSAPTAHTFSVELRPGTCNGRSGIPSNIIATGVQIDVIGFR